MTALIAFLANLLELPPAVVGAGLIVLGVVLVIALLAIVTRHVFRYLERRSDNELIAKLIEKSNEPQASLIQAIRGPAIPGASNPPKDGAIVDAEVSGAVGRVTGWLRDLKLIPGG